MFSSENQPSKCVGGKIGEKARSNNHEIVLIKKVGGQKSKKSEKRKGFGKEYDGFVGGLGRKMS